MKEMASLIAMVTMYCAAWQIVLTKSIQKQKEVGGPMTDDEAQALEDAILDVMAKDQENVSNEELRHYMNETIWFAAKQTVKIKQVKNLQFKMNIL